MPMRRDRDPKSGERKACIKLCNVQRQKMGAMSYLEGNVRCEFKKAFALSTYVECIL